MLNSKTMHSTRTHSWRHEPWTV